MGTGAERCRGAGGSRGRRRRRRRPASGRGGRTHRRTTRLDREARLLKASAPARSASAVTIARRVAMIDSGSTATVVTSTCARALIDADAAENTYVQTRGSYKSSPWSRPRFFSVARCFRGSVHGGRTRRSTSALACYAARSKSRTTPPSHQTRETRRRRFGGCNAPRAYTAATTTASGPAVRAGRPHS